MTREESLAIRATISDFRPLEAVAENRLNRVNARLQTEVDEIKLRHLQGQAEEIRFWMKLGTLVNNGAVAQ
jgi:hypothetical protein